MLRIRCATGEVEIEGTRKDYAALRFQLNQLISAPDIWSIEFVCDAAFDPSPYEQNCQKMKIEIGSGPNEFSVSDSVLKVEGSSAALMNLGENLPDDSEISEGIIQSHHHYDVYSFPEYVASDSPAVVLLLKP